MLTSVQSVMLTMVKTTLTAAITKVLTEKGQAGFQDYSMIDKAPRTRYHNQLELTAWKRRTKNAQRHRQLSVTVGDKHPLNTQHCERSIPMQPYLYGHM